MFCAGVGKSRESPFVVKDVQMTDATDRAGASALAQVTTETELAHHGLRHLFERIEHALRDDDLASAARLLGDLIEQAREHFIIEERIALGAGRSEAAGKLAHDAFLERARRLQTNCRQGAGNDSARQPGPSRADLQAGLVMLLSDLVESDLRLQSRLDGKPEGAT